ncbi:MAG: glycosyltransferase family 2 protein [archaeon]
MKKLTVLIPCYNEELLVGEVIDYIPIDLFKKLDIKVEIIVIDNNSTDKTAEIAKSKGARVIFEKKRGKGNALKTGFKNISKDTDYVVMLDGDSTYKSKEMLRMIEPLYSDFCDVVIGSRLSGKMKSGSMTYFNRIGNWFFTFLVRYFYQGNVTDVCTGYFAWKREVVENLVKYLDSGGFSIEMEMVTKMVKLKYSIFSVPVTYRHRNGTKSRLRPIKDGLGILSVFFKNLNWKPEDNL